MLGAMLRRLEPLDAKLAKALEAEEQARQQLQSLEESWGWLRRFFFRERYRRQRDPLAGRVEQCSTASRGLRREIESLRGWFLGVGREVVLPYFAWVHALEALDAEVDQARARLQTFVADLSRDVQAGQQAAPRPPDEGPIRRTAYTDRVLDALYSDLGEECSPARHLDALFALHTLGEDYERGPDELAQHMEAYAETRFAMVTRMDVGDVVDSDDAEQLRGCLRQLRRPVATAAALVPEVERAHGCRASVLARSAPTPATKLEPRFTSLPGEFDCHLKDDGTEATVVELVAVTAGLPAFVLHCVDSGRDRALRAPNAQVADLRARRTPAAPVARKPASV